MYEDDGDDFGVGHHSIGPDRGCQTGELQERERVIGQVSEFVTDSRGLMTFHGRIWVPFMGGLRSILMEEAQKSRFPIHPGPLRCIYT